jgi:ferritin-like metal-binding protein YciE
MSKQTKAASRNGSSRSSTKNGSRPSDAKQQQHMEQGELAMNSSVEKLFVDQLRDIYYVEKNLVKSLSKMAKKATTQELQDAFLEHQQVTQVHAERLEQVFNLLGKKAQAKRCPVMDGLMEEADEMTRDTEDDTLTRDVALIISAQKVEHYEIATYGCLATLARTYGMDEVADLLHETLEEEKEADQTLTYIAENNVNHEAGQEEEEEE